uniref:Uncharacterized protein n=1 Tax=Arundo donax TaxID=35708 RepID=A0A0A9BM86_ARUDO
MKCILPDTIFWSIDYCASSTYKVVYCYTFIAFFW